MLSKILGYCRKQSIIRRPKRYWASDLTAANYSLISTQPPIMYVAHWMDGKLAFMSSMDMVFEALRNRRAYFLYRWCWHIEDPQRVKTVRQFEKQHRRKYPKHHFIHFCNTIRQHEVFQENALDAAFCNHNCFVDENIFKPLPSVPKRYDAVYDARLKNYKRHYLASEIDNLALIYAFQPMIDDVTNVEKVRRQFSHARFFNHTYSLNYKSLSPQEVNQCLNECKVGLCLSKVEGAMLASVQYLLSGLPVVSTKSKGGRDVFFDEDYVLIVDDKPRAVREGVEEMIRRNIPSDLIRQKTLEKIRTHRAVLVTLVQDIFDMEGEERDFAAEWDVIFFNRLVKHQSHAETIRQIKTGSKQFQ